MALQRSSGAVAVVGAIVPGVATGGDDVWSTEAVMGSAGSVDAVDDGSLVEQPTATIANTSSATLERAWRSMSSSAAGSRGFTVAP